MFKKPNNKRLLLFHDFCVQNLLYAFYRNQANEKLLERN